MIPFVHPVSLLSNTYIIAGKSIYSEISYVYRNDSR